MSRKISLITLFVTVVMLASLSAVFADEETYTVNYVTYEEDITIGSRTVHWDDTVTYTDSSYPIEEQYEDCNKTFMGWYTGPDFQKQCTDEMTYGEVAGDKSVTSITLYAWIKHEHDGASYTPWGYTDRLPDQAGNWYLMEDVHLKDYNRGDTAAWTAPEGATNLCLDDHGIYRDTISDDIGDIDCSVIEVPEGADLTITDTGNSKSISGGNAGEGMGGGIVVRGNLTMLGGVIKGNTASDGGGIAVLENGRLNLLSGSITGNSVSEGGKGGGVYLDSTAALRLGADGSSTPVISGNRSGESSSDLSVDGGETWNAIEVGGLGVKSRIGIETRNLPDGFDTEVPVTSGLGETTVSPFFSNDSRLEIAASGEGASREAVVRYTRNTVTFMAGDEQFDVQTVYGGQKASRPEPDPTREGSAFIEWLYNDKPYDFDEPVLEDMTMIARFDSDHYHDGRLFRAWTSEDSLPSESGAYYLTENITLKSTHRIENTVDIHICLNGHTVTKADGGSLILLQGSSKAPHLSMYDHSDGEEGKLTGANGDTGAVDVRGSGAVFTMNGGQITGNGTAAINIYKGTAVMNGGTISNNTEHIPYFGDYTAPSGGVRAVTGAVFRMNGGKICDNTGTGIAVCESTLELGGGLITGNTIIPDEDGDTSIPGGAGVYAFYDSTVRFTGSDKITITDNKFEDEESNVYLGEGSDKDLQITFSDDCIMNEDSRIGISTLVKPTEEEPVVFTGGFSGHALLSNFIPDSGEYQIRKNDEGEAELYYDPISIRVSFDANGGSGEMSPDTAGFNQEYELPECTFVPAQGYEFDGWLIGDEKYDEKETVKLRGDTVIKAGWKTISYKIEYDLAGGSEETGKENPSEYTVESGDITLNSPVRADYMFTGWTGTGIDGQQMEVTVRTGSTGDRSYKANWTPVRYSIAYFLNDGVLPEGQQNPYWYTVESDDITLIAPVKEGSTFSGWYLVGSDKAASADMVLPKGSSGNKTFIAVWGDADHEHSLTKVDAVPATADENGNIEYFVCGQCDKAFADEAGTEELDKTKTVDDGGVIVHALSHGWNEPVYVWADDNSSVTASHSCPDCGLTEEETVSVTDEVIKQPTETKTGEARYTSAAFKNPAFAVQTKTEEIPAKGYAPGKDPNQKGTDGTAVGPGASAAAAEKAITARKSDKDPKGAVYSKLRLKSSRQTKSSIKVTWSKLSKAKKYVIYGNKCGARNKPVKLVQTTANSRTLRKVAGKKVKAGTKYMFIVVALDKDNNVVSTSKVIHAAAKSSKICNYKSVTVSKKIIAKAKSLKAGKSVSLKARAVKQSKKLKVKKCVGLRYESTNTKIAQVNTKGTVKGKARGTCYVYAYAQNGVSKKIKITVK